MHIDIKLSRKIMISKEMSWTEGYITEICDYDQINVIRYVIEKCIKSKKFEGSRIDNVGLAYAHIRDEKVYFGITGVARCFAEIKDLLQ